MWKFENVKITKFENLKRWKCNFITLWYFDNAEIWKLENEKTYFWMVNISRLMCTMCACLTNFLYSNSRIVLGLTIEFTWSLFFSATVFASSRSFLASSSLIFIGKFIILSNTSFILNLICLKILSVKCWMSFAPALASLLSSSFADYFFCTFSLDHRFFLIAHSAPFRWMNSRHK